MSLNSELVSMEPNISGFLKRRSEWSEAVASQIAKKEKLVLTDKHWDIINFVRTEFYANNGTVPLERHIKRGMEREWGTPVSNSDIRYLLPGGSIQAAKIAGCITITTVEDLLEVKGDAVWSIKPDQAVIDALAVLSEKNIGALMVVESDNLVGVVSERDITREVLLKGWSPTETKVQDIMSENIVSVAPAETLEECMAVMVERGFRHLPVLEQGRLAGVLSMPDLARVIVDQQQFTIASLTDYKDASG